MLAEPHPGRTSPCESSLGSSETPHYPRWPFQWLRGSSRGGGTGTWSPRACGVRLGAQACGTVWELSLSAGNQRRGPRSTRQSRPPSWNPRAPPWLCPGLRLKCQGQERGLVGTGGTDGPWGCPGRSLRPSGWLPCCAADLGPEGVPWVSSPAGPSCSLHGLPRRPLLACRQRVAGPRPRGQDIPSEVMMPIT